MKAANDAGSEFHINQVQYKMVIVSYHLPLLKAVWSLWCERADFGMEHELSSSMPARVVKSLQQKSLLVEVILNLFFFQF